MKKIIIIIILLALSGEVSAEDLTPFERWARGIDLVVEEVYENFGGRICLAGKEHNIDKKYLWALVVVESNGDLDAKSETHVRGITQLTMSVIEKIKGKTGITIDRKHPYEALWGASWYIRHLIDHYNFELNEAVTAYYYGPTGLRNKLKEKELKELYYFRKIKHVLEIIETLISEGFSFAIFFKKATMK